MQTPGHQLPRLTYRALAVKHLLCVVSDHIASLSIIITSLMFVVIFHMFFILVFPTVYLYLPNEFVYILIQYIFLTFSFWGSPMLISKLICFYYWLVLYCEYSHALHNDLSVNDRPYIWQWSYKIKTELIKSCHLVMLKHHNHCLED